MHFFVIYIYICGVKCRVVFKVGRPEFPFDAQSDLWVGPTNINLLIANRISPIYTQIFTYFQQYFLIFIITFAQSDLLVANINFPLFTQTYFLWYFLILYFIINCITSYKFSPMSKCKSRCHWNWGELLGELCFCISGRVVVNLLIAKLPFHLCVWLLTHCFCLSSVD